jgi:hypothetical protein
LDLDEAKADVIVGELLVAEVLAAEATHERGELLVLLHLLAHALDLLGHPSEPLRPPHSQANVSARSHTQTQTQTATTAAVKGGRESGSKRWERLELTVLERSLRVLLLREEEEEEVDGFGSVATARTRGSCCPRRWRRRPGSAGRCCATRPKPPQCRRCGAAAAAAASMISRAGNLVGASLVV